MGRFSLKKWCDGVIGAAAPCDYMPHAVRAQKISKTGQPLMIELIETPDVVASLGQCKRDDQWVVGFALETEDQRDHFVHRSLVRFWREERVIMSMGRPSLEKVKTSLWK